jgi:hypothetical protein
MKIDIADITNGAQLGKIVWVCDYRRPDLSKKVLRHVPPTQVVIVDNSELSTNVRVHYSSCHFVKMKNGVRTKKVIKPFDNTGWRIIPGTPLQVFTTEQECNDAYKTACDIIVDALMAKRQIIDQQLVQEALTVLNNKEAIA